MNKPSSLSGLILLALGVGLSTATLVNANPLAGGTVTTFTEEIPGAPVGKIARGPATFSKIRPLEDSGGATRGRPVTVPEVGSLLAALAGFGLILLRSKDLRKMTLPVLTVAFLIPLKAAVTIVSLTPSLTPPQPVETVVSWTVSANDPADSSPHLWYRFRVRPPNGNFSTIVDYGPLATLSFTPSPVEGLYTIEVSVRNLNNGSIAVRTATFTFTSRAIGSTPVVSPTAHPLVALYSAPQCPAGSSIRVRFKLASDVNYHSTALQPCNGTTSMNILVAGMQGNSTYELKQDVIAGSTTTTGPSLYFNTGTPAFTPPGFSVLQAPQQSASSLDDTLMQQLLLAATPYATNLNGTLLWYYLNPLTAVVYRPEPGGNFVVGFHTSGDLERSGVREADLAGNTLKETTVARLNEQLATLGYNPITTIHHEARRLANGYFLMLSMSERFNTPQGAGVDVLGDMILGLDPDLQLKGVWDSFAHLDVSRKAILGETCANGQAGCVLVKGTIANDWTHGNSVALTPDGNILYSSRHQDFVYKISAGTGGIIWKLGKGGDFTYLNTSDPWPWQSHQHDVEYDPGSSNIISLFDNGNTRVSQGGNPDSRGQVLRINEAARTVTFVQNVDIGLFSMALGTAQRLSNGNYTYDAGSPPDLAAEYPEYTQSGTQVSRFEVPVQVYRIYRYPDLYSAPW